jgi:peroxiredoxin Q/BCP
MAQLRQDFQGYLDRDTEVVVVGPDNQKAFQKYFDENQLPFIGIPDPKHSILKTYGQEVNLFKLGRMPAQATIDKDGMVRYIHYGHEMSDIPSNAEIFEILDGMDGN